jgi:hypothetical protein
MDARHLHRAWTGRWLALVALSAACKTGGAGTDGGPDDPTDTEPTVPACADATLTPALTAAGATLNLPLEPEGPARQLAARAVEIGAVEVALGSVTVAVDGPFTLLGADGVALTAPLTLAPGDLPRTVYVASTDWGEGALTATPAEGCAAATVPLRAGRHVELAVRALGAAPWVAHAQTWRSDHPVEVLVDAAEHPDRVGLPFDAYVVPHRNAAGWLASPELVDATGTVETGEVQAAGPRANTLTVWDGPEVIDLYASAWDVVLDFGQDGRVDPGDLIDGLGATPGFWSTPDLTAPGPWPTDTRLRDDGTWLKQQVWFPAAPPGPMPLVIISHGNGHDYRWYDHLGEHLASWGFVVMSHSNNTGPGVETASTTTLTNTEHFVENYAGWWSGILQDRIDLTNISWVGHSRGGEGVARAFERLRSGDWTTSAFAPADIRVISSIAPTVFLGVNQSNPGNKPYHLIAGGSDGDVTGGADCDICQYLRLPYASTGVMSVSYVHGASHNKFHNGGGWDDSTGPAPLAREEVHAVQKAIYLSLLGWQQRGVTAYAEWLGSNWEVRRPQGAPGTATVAQVLRQDLDGADVLVIDRFQTEATPELNDLGGAVTWTTAEVSEDELDDRNRAFNWQVSDVFNGATHVEGDGFERGGSIGWDADGAYTTALPAGSRDLRGYDFVSLAAAQSSRHPATTAHDGAMGFTLELEDGAGVTAQVPADAYGLITPVYPRTGLGAGAGWANEMNTVRVPLRAFLLASSALDLSDIRALRVLLGPSHGAATGRLIIDDIYLGRTE